MLLSVVCGVLRLSGLENSAASPRRSFLLYLLVFLTVKSSLCLIRNTSTRADVDTVTIDPRTEHVFVAGTNIVYKYDRFLKLEASGSTGPHQDTCRPPNGHCDNEARILEIIPSSENLLFCGSSRNGLCSVIDVENMSVIDLNSTNRLNFAGGRENVFGFFSNNSAESNLKPAVLYVASSYDGRPQNALANAISARTVENRGGSLFNLSYLYENGSIKSAVDINPSQRSNYVIRYVYGFEHKGFSYFVTVQGEHMLPDASYETRLVRVCQKDVGFFSYTEVTLICKKSRADPESYNIALSAYLSTAGKEMSKKMTLTAGESVLYVILGRSAQSSAAAVPDNGFGLCVYSMSEVRKAFTIAQKDCYQGKGQLIPWINFNEPRCIANIEVAKEINDNFCGTVSNVGIASRYPLQTETNFSTDAYLGTSIRTMSVFNKTVALIGTTSGHLLKIVVDGTDSVPYDVIDLGSGSAIRRDMELDKEEQNIYVLSGRKISMVPLKTCGLYRDCSTCIMTKDPLGCGWCSDHCSTRSECGMEWFNGHCPPVVHSFHPRTGPVEGGTVVTIHGRNFGNGTWSGSQANVKIASNSECSIEFRNSSCIVCKTKPKPPYGPFDRELRVSVTDTSKTTVGFEIRGASPSMDDSFSYKVAAVKDIFPLMGPMSGGTNLTVTGSNLDIGSNLTVKVVGKPCLVASLNSSHIMCSTSSLNTTVTDQLKSSVTMKGFVDVTIDNAQLTRGHYEYSYCEDPVIFDISPNRSILSGGINLTVTGKNLHCVSRPRIYANLVNEEIKYSDECEPEYNGTVMICRSPNLKPTSNELSPQQVKAELRFAMDGLKNLWDFPKTQPNLSFLVYTLDPEVFPYMENESSEVPQQNHHVLRLQGRHLNLSATENDYNVTIGSQQCHLTKLTANELICSHENSVTLHQRDITVKIGNLVFTPGHIKPKELLGTGEQNINVTISVVGSIILASTVCVIACLICLKCYQRGPFRRKFQTVRNVLYSSGSHVDVATNRVTETATWAPVPNSYLSHSEAVQQRLTRNNGHASGEPILDEDSRRLLNDSHLLISRDRLVLSNVIGLGHFGCVFRGFLKLGPKEEMEVAVKTLKTLPECVYMSPTESRKFLDEALTMREFDHIHVLKLIGIVIDKEELPLVVLPFMRHGDLLSYIRSESNSPTVKDLMEIGTQIADGMNYLANLKFVHRDLAARNCMLDDDMLVKVADFGLSRDIYERDYYSSDDRKAKLPVKWMALESLEKGIYSTKTDIWSFGVVLWELMTRGICPYPEVDNWDIVRYLKSGRRMPQPTYCPDSIYNIMLHCWNADYTQRPTFSELASAIHGIIDEVEGTQYATGLNVTYINADVQGHDYLSPIDSRYPENAFSFRNNPQHYLSVASSESTLV